MSENHLNTVEHFDIPSFALFAKGFRCFFLGAILLAASSIIIWSLYYSGLISNFFHYYSPTIWHVHEMVFGYGGAVIAGFLLTAVSAWTGRETLKGGFLAGLFIIWLAAHVFPFIPTVPGLLIAFLNVLFFVVLAISVAVPIILSGNYRNLFVLVILLGLGICSALIHSQLLGFTETGITVALNTAFYIQLLLIFIFSGRVFPMFSSGGVATPYEPVRNNIIEIASIVSFISFAVVIIAELPWVLRVGVTLITVAIHYIRIMGWFNRQIFQVPLVWVLHVGYYFLILGMLLTGVADLNSITRVAGLHAMLVGGLGLITAGIMARVSLGHTGRNIHQPPRTLSMVFLTIAFAALIRVFVPIITPELYLIAIRVSGALWAIAFLWLTVLYTPFLLRARVDGNSG